MIKSFLMMKMTKLTEPVSKSSKKRVGTEFSLKILDRTDPGQKIRMTKSSLLVSRNARDAVQLLKAHSLTVRRLVRGGDLFWSDRTLTARDQSKRNLQNLKLRSLRPRGESVEAGRRIHICVLGVTPTVQSHLDGRDQTTVDVQRLKTLVEHRQKRQAVKETEIHR